MYGYSDPRGYTTPRRFYQEPIYSKTVDEAWNTLEGSLRRLKDSPYVSQPLQATAVNHAIDPNQELTLELTETIDDLEVNVRSLICDEKISKSVRNMIGTIQGHVELVQENTEHVKGPRYHEIQYQQDMARCYQTIATMFQKLEADARLSLWSSIHPEDARQSLMQLAPVKAAKYDFVEWSGWRSGCMPNTCVAALDAYKSWSDDPYTSGIYWIYGASGVGKTTIAYTCCEELAQNNRLAANFFCSEVSPVCRDIKRIVPTIAYQLSRFSYAFQSRLCDILQAHPEFMTYDLCMQFEKLVVEPLQATSESLPPDLVIVLDSLDECHDWEGARALLGAIIRYVSESCFHVNCNLRFLVTSGPELVTELGTFISRVLRLYHLNPKSTHQDIASYIAQDLDSPEPTDFQIRILTDHAKGSFIYAKTCVRTITAWTHPTPEPTSIPPATLMAILRHGQQNRDPLDELYMNILTNALGGSGTNRNADKIKLTLKTVLCTRQPMSLDSLATILKLNGKNQVLQLLWPLFPILHVSGTGSSVFIYHRSFRTFITHPQRSGIFYCNDQQQNCTLACVCLDIMEDKLRFNICKRELSYALDRNIPGLFDQAQQIISPELMYACRYLGEHVECAEPSIILVSKIKDFLSNRLLSWMEVLNLRQCMNEGVSALAQVDKWLTRNYSPGSVHELVRDARSFVAYFADSPTSQNTSQIYISALPSWPTNDLISHYYLKGVQRRLREAGLSTSGRDAALLSVWPVDSGVTSLSTSIDGTKVLFSSESTSSNMGFWDSDSGTKETPSMFRACDGRRVNTTTFSFDGSYVASGLNNHKIIVFNLKTTEEPPLVLEGHAGPCNSVAFSPNSNIIASGSNDYTVRIWTLSKSQPFRVVGHQVVSRHSDSVSSVAFSHDGTLIASGSKDQTICVTDINRPEISTKANGHTGSVKSVAFSPNGRFLASGSRDCTIRFWVTEIHHRYSTRLECLSYGSPIQWHTKAVSSIAFSPNSTRIASGSKDLTVCVWEVPDGGRVAGPFRGHNRPITSVLYMPDGTRVVSGSDDGTIRIWDTETQTASAQLSPDETASPMSIRIETGTMSALDMFTCLKKHGCPDLTNAVDNKTISEHKVATGGYGDIWKGRLQNGTEVAIKVWRFEAQSTSAEKQKSLKRAMRELYNWSKTNHVNIHKLLGVIVFQGQLGMVSRWMEHGNLQRYIEKYKPSNRYQLCLQVARGLCYMHGKNMVHGDLKAANILVSSDGTPKLNDFDHSIMYDSNLIFSTTTNNGGGTLRWMAPELVVPETASPRSKETDVHSLGMTFLEVITGDVPYSYQNEFQVMRKLMEKTPPKRTDHFNRDERGNQMWALLLRCWGDPAARPTAFEVLDSLQDLINATTLKCAYHMY